MKNKTIVFILMLLVVPLVFGIDCETNSGACSLNVTTEVIDLGSPGGTGYPDECETDDQCDEDQECISGDCVNNENDTIILKTAPLSVSGDVEPVQMQKVVEGISESMSLDGFKREPATAIVLYLISLGGLFFLFRWFFSRLRKSGWRFRLGRKKR